MTLNDPPILYVIVCAAGPAGQVTRLINDARARGWDSYLITTPAAMDFIDVKDLESQTGHPVRSKYQVPGNAASSRSLPKANAIIVAPATYNTINKWANGISDNFALGILAEAVGLHIPVVVLPFVNSALASHPAFQHSVALLRDTGIDVIHGPGRLEPHAPGTGGTKFDTFPWHQALDQADRLRGEHEQSARPQQDAPRSALTAEFSRIGSSGAAARRRARRQRRAQPPKARAAHAGPACSGARSKWLIRHVARELHAGVWPGHDYRGSRSAFIRALAAPKSWRARHASTTEEEPAVRAWYS